MLGAVLKRTNSTNLFESLQNNMQTVLPVLDPWPLLLKTAKGYRPCLASVLSHTGKAEVAQDRIIWDRKSYVELEIQAYPSPTRMGSGRRSGGLG